MCHCHQVQDALVKEYRSSLTWVVVVVKVGTGALSMATILFSLLQAN